MCNTQQNIQSTIKQRNASIDLLRSIAIIGIIIAHCTPNLFLIQLRGFDVVLMVFLSAICSNKFGSENFNYFDYFTKRCIRLILPVWIFLIIYYCGVYFFYYLPPFQEILASFTFFSDRYVWIIRILVMLSLLTPYLYKLTTNSSPTQIIVYFCIIVLACEIIFKIQNNEWANLIFMTMPYGLVYILGIN